MTFRDILQRSEKVLVDNSPAIMTGIGVLGTLTTAYLSGKASFRAAEILAADTRDREIFEKSNPGELQPRDAKDVVKLVWKLYIPSVAVAAVTCTAIIAANRVGTRRAAAMAAAYSVSERAYSEYRDKVVEKLGEAKEKKVRDEIAQDHVDSNPSSKAQVIITGNGDVLCYDKYTGRYFESNMEAIKKAQNDLNYQLLNGVYASLNDFYEKLGVDRVSQGDEVGWVADKGLMELDFSTTMSDDQRPCLAFDFTVQPIRNYYKAH